MPPLPAFALDPLLQGFALGASLIIAIGAQNAFVLRQGLKRQYMFAIAGISALCDAVLILLGIGGLGAVITGNPALTALATWGGAAFLFFYGGRAFKSAARPAAMHVNNTGSRPAGSLTGAVMAAFGFSLLNPNVYLDTVVLIGSLGARYPAEPRLFFGTGAILASFIWFFSLAYGAAWLSPMFQRPVVWRILDLIIGGVMWAIAASLLWEPVKAMLA